MPCGPRRRGAERGHAGHRGRRHPRQPHGRGRRQELGAVRSARGATNGRSRRCSTRNWAWCCRCHRASATTSCRPCARTASRPCSHFVGKTRPYPAHRRGQGGLQGGATPRACSVPSSRPAPGLGRRELADLPAPRQPACADAEHAAAGAARRPWPACAPHVRPGEDVAAPFSTSRSPRWPCCASRA